MPANIHPVEENYGIRYWGEGFFGINAEGHVTVLSLIHISEPTRRA